MSKQNLAYAALRLVWGLGFETTKNLFSHNALSTCVKLRMKPVPDPVTQVILLLWKVPVSPS